MTSDTPSQAARVEAVSVTREMAEAGRRAIADERARVGMQYPDTLAVIAYQAMAPLAPASPPAEALPSQTSGAEDGGDPERIWLEPRNIDNDYGPEGRLWCEDRVWPEGDEQGEPTEYIRADLALASAPAPASGEVDAVAVREAVDHVLMTHTGLQFALPSDAERFKARILASLSPAPTSGSEGGERLLRQLRALAVALHEKHYADDGAGWQPLEDAEGILSQIDNMTTGLSRLSLTAERLDAACASYWDGVWNDRDCWTGDEKDRERERMRRATGSILAKPASSPAGGGEEAETKGPYEARLCKGIPTDCCDFGVVSLSEGREVCRAWREQDARAIAAALAKPSPAGGGVRLGLAVELLAAYHAIDAAWGASTGHQRLAKHDALAAIHEASRVLSSPASSSPAEAEALQAGVESLLSDSRVDMAWADGARAAMKALDRYLPDCPITRKMERRIAWRERSAIAGRKKAASLSSAPAQEDGSKDLGAHPRAVPTSPWQPIETAPKDGTMLILHCPIDGSIWFARWASFGWYGVDEFGLRRDAFAERVELDAWRPLPPPPEGSGRNRADATNNPVPLTLSDAGSDAEGRDDG